MKDVGGINSIAYIYEYYLTCDSLRFVLIYNLEKDKPELFKLNIEPLETENPMIIFQLTKCFNERINLNEEINNYLSSCSISNGVFRDL